MRTTLLALLLAGLAALGWAAPAPSAPVAGEDPQVALLLESPLKGDTLAAPLVVSGWAADPRAGSGPGIDVDNIQVWLGAPERGRFLGRAEPMPRPDVPASLNANFEVVGFRWTWDPCSLAPGPWGIYVRATSTVDRAAYHTRSADVMVAGCPESAPAAPPTDLLGVRWDLVEEATGGVRGEGIWTLAPSREELRSDYGCCKGIVHVRLDGARVEAERLDDEGSAVGASAVYRGSFGPDWTTAGGTVEWVGEDYRQYFDTDTVAGTWTARITR
jgi:hypothetical protein